MAEQQKAPQSKDDRLNAALSYVWIVSLIMYATKRDNEFVAFHARQGIVLFIASLLGVIPVIGWIIVLIAVIAMIIGFMKANDGAWYKFPVIGDLAERFK
jgi:uncharacterized membrane protein